MTNAELIEKLRILQNKNSLSLYKREVCRDAAAALEAAEQRIEQLEKQEPTEKQVVDYCHKRCLVIVEEELFQRMKATFSRMPKEGEWIEKWRFKTDGTPFHKIGDMECSVCHSDMLGRYYSRYCPHCGAKMKGANDADN